MWEGLEIVVSRKVREGQMSWLYHRGDRSALAVPGALLSLPARAFPPQ